MGFHRGSNRFAHQRLGARITNSWHFFKVFYEVAHCFSLFFLFAHRAHLYRHHYTPQTHLYFNLVRSFVQSERAPHNFYLLSPLLFQSLRFTFVNRTCFSFSLSCLPIFCQCLFLYFQLIKIGNSYKMSSLN